MTTSGRTPPFQSTVEVQLSTFQAAGWNVRFWPIAVVQLAYLHRGAGQVASSRASRMAYAVG